MATGYKPAEPSKQLTLCFTPGLTTRFRNVRDAVAQGVYQRGLKNVAGDMDIAPGNLSVALADDTQRKFCVDELERYIQVTGDLTPVYFLVEKYLGNQEAARDQAMNQMLGLLQQMPELMAMAGIAQKKR